LFAFRGFCFDQTYQSRYFDLEFFRASHKKSLGNSGLWLCSLRIDFT
jgi:hypothetical protein